MPTDPEAGPANRPVRVYVVDDHAVVRQGIREVLIGAGGFEIAGESGSVVEALREVEALEPDVAVVDVRLPDGDGIELVREVRSRRPGTRCIILTSFADEQAFFHSVMAGAVGFLNKDAPTGEIVDAVRRVAAGQRLVNEELLDELRARARRLPPEDRFLADLTPQERRILTLVTRALTNREIAEELSLAEKTVRNYVSNILGKLGMKNRTELAAYVAERAAASWREGTPPRRRG